MPATTTILGKQTEPWHICFLVASGSALRMKRRLFLGEMNRLPSPLSSTTRIWKALGAFETETADGSQEECLHSSREAKSTLTPLAWKAASLPTARERETDGRTGREI